MGPAREARGRRLRQNRNRVAEVEQVVEALNLRDAHGNAAVRPGDIRTRAVQADFAAQRRFPRRALPAGNGRADRVGFSSGDEPVAFAPAGILGVRITQAEKSMVPAGRVFGADVEITFGRGAVAFALFVS